MRMKLGRPPPSSVLDGVASDVLEAESRLTCPLCSNLAPEVPRFTLPCGHIFCATCADQALFRANECPTCKNYTQPKDASRTYCMDALLEAYNSFLNSAPALQSRVGSLQRRRDQRAAVNSEVIIDKNAGIEVEGVDDPESEARIQPKYANENDLSSKYARFSEGGPIDNDNDDRMNIENANNGKGERVKRRVPDTYASQQVNESKSKWRMVADTYSPREHDQFFRGDSIEGYSQPSFQYGDSESLLEALPTRQCAPLKVATVVRDTYHFEDDEAEAEAEAEDAAGRRDDIVAETAAGALKEELEEVQGEEM